MHQGCFEQGGMQIAELAALVGSAFAWVGRDPLQEGGEFEWGLFEEFVGEIFDL